MKKRKEEEFELTEIKIDKLPIEGEVEVKKSVNKKKSKKNLLLIVGIIIELLIILLIVVLTNINKEKYKMTVTCTNITDMDEYSIVVNNTYYFDNKDRVAKQENEVNYIYNKKEDYMKLKNNYVSTNIENYKGLTQTTAFDDTNYIYQSKTIYKYDDLKKNKKVKYKNNILVLNLPEKQKVTIPIQTYNSVLMANEKMGFKCN